MPSHSVEILCPEHHWHLWHLHWVEYSALEAQLPSDLESHMHFFPFPDILLLLTLPPPPTWEL